MRPEILLDEDHRRRSGIRLGLTDNEKAALYPDVAKQGMADMSKKFIDMGAQVYVDQAAVVKESNKAL